MGYWFSYPVPNCTERLEGKFPGIIQHVLLSVNMCVRLTLLLSILIDYSFSLMYSITLFGYFSINVSIIGIWVFSSLCLINYGTVNVMYMIFWPDTSLHFFCTCNYHRPRRGISESRYMFVQLSNYCKSIFPSGSSNLYFYQQCVRIPLLFIFPNTYCIFHLFISYSDGHVVVSYCGFNFAFCFNFL